MLPILVPILVPILCSILYPIGTLLAKRAFARDADLWTVAVVNYWVMALVFLPVLLLDARPIPWNLWWQPALMGLCSFAGQAFGFKAISFGDLTVATPALSSKVLLVALFTVAVLHLSVPLGWWLAAGFSFAAVFFLQAGAHSARRKTAVTLAYSLLTALCFALGDVLIQKWSPGWGAFHFMPAFAIASACYSVVLIPWMKKPLLGFSRHTWKWLLAGTGILSLQALGLTLVIGIFHRVTQANVLFSARGLWNFLIIWFVGHWFKNTERAEGGRVMAFRLVGAGLMFAAIVLVSLTR